MVDLGELQEERACERRFTIPIREEEWRKEELKQGQRDRRRDMGMDDDDVERRRNRVICRR